MGKARSRALVEDEKRDAPAPPAAGPVAPPADDRIVEPRSELELLAAYLDALQAGGLAQPAAVLRPVISYGLGTDFTESTMLGVQCAPGQSGAVSERELLLALGQALPAGTAPELASAAVSLIADCDADRCFEDGLDLMLAGLRGRRDDAVR